VRNQLLPNATALVLVAGMTTSVMAFGGGFQNGGVGGSSVGSLHSGYRSFRGSYGSRRAGNFSGIRGYTSWRQGG
jgi:hypothetical protein